MIHKTSEISPDGGQAGAAIYEYYPIYSDVSELNGYGMYMHNNKDVAVWSESNDLETTIYINTSVEVYNFDVAYGNFVMYVKSKRPKESVFKVENVESSHLGS